MANLAITGGNYELRTQEFPAAPGSTEANMPPHVAAWGDNNQPGVEVAGGVIDKIFPPIFLGQIGNAHPIWMYVYFVVLAKGH